MKKISKESSQALVARYFATSQPQLRAFIRSLIFNPSDVDDVLQDTAVVAIEKADRFDPQQGEVGAWVMGIARNRVLKYLDKAKRQKLRFSGELVDLIANAAIKAPESSDTLDALETCLGALDRNKRELLIRRHLPGMTSTKLASEIGYTDSRMSRMLNSLYVALIKCVRNSTYTS